GQTVFVGRQRGRRGEAPRGEQQAKGRDEQGFHVGENSVRPRRFRSGTTESFRRSRDGRNRADKNQKGHPRMEGARGGRERVFPVLLAAVAAAGDETEGHHAEEGGGAGGLGNGGGGADDLEVVEGEHLAAGAVELEADVGGGRTVERAEIEGVELPGRTVADAALQGEEVRAVGRVAEVNRAGAVAERGELDHQIRERRAVELHD